MKTIRRNSKRAATMFQDATSCKVYSLENNFHATDCPVSWAEKQYRALEFAKARENDDNTVTIRLHSNCWYELSF